MAKRQVNVYRLKTYLTGYAFIAPGLFGFLIFLGLPTIAAFVLSGYDWNLLSKPKFIGLTNFVNLVGDPTFWNALKVTLLYILYNVPIETVLAIILAITLNRRLPGVVLFRVLFVLPWITTPVAVSLIWKWVLNPQFGMVSYFLSVIGLDSRSILLSPQSALPQIALVNLWEFTGYQMMLFLAGLQGIPRQLYEASDLDGATGMQRAWYITLPLLKPTTMFVLITSVIGSFQVFDTVYIMTQGGPGDATRVYYYYLYQNAFQFFKMGYASSMAVILFILIMAFTIAQFLYFRRQITYDLD